MRKSLFSIILSLVTCGVLQLNGQTADTTFAHQVFLEALDLKEQDAYRGALAKFQEATSLFIEALDSNHTRIAELYMYQSGLFSILQQTQKRHEVNLKSLDIVKLNGVENTFLGADIHNALGISSSNLRIYEDADYHYKKAIQISRQWAEDEYDLAPIFGNLGILSRRTGKYDDALAYLSKSMKIYSDVHELPGVARSHINLGNVYLGLFENEKALYHYQQALTHEDTIVKNHPAVAFSAYQGIAKYYKDHLEYDFALLNYEKAKTSLLYSFDMDHPYYLRNERLISDVYHKIGRHQQAIKVILDDVERLEGELKEGYAYEILAQNYRAIDSMEQAKFFIEKSLELVTQQKGIDSRDYVYPLLEKALNLLKEKKYHEAEPVFLAVRRRMKEFLPEDHPRIARTEIFLSEVYGQTGRFDEALTYCDQALIKLGHHPDSIFAYENSKVLRTWEVAHRTKAIILFMKYQKTGTIEHANEALKYQLAHINYLNEIQSSLIEKTSKLQLLNKQHKVSERSIQILLDLHDQQPGEGHLVKAFEIADLAKDNLLAELNLRKQVREQESRTIEFGDKESSLLAEIADLELEVFRLEEGGAPEIEVLAIKNNILEKREQIIKFSDDRSINKVNSRRINALNERTQEWQKMIPEDIAVIEFFSGVEDTYVLILTSEGYAFGARLKSDLVEEKTSGFRSSLLDIQSTVWHRSGSELYNILLDNAISSLNPRIKKLVFILDGQITGIPLEALVMDENGTMLIDNFIVSYSPSLGVLITEKDYRRGARKTFAAFAPSYEEMQIQNADTVGAPQFTMLVRSGDYHLPGAQEEVKQIQALTKGSLFLGAKANETTFKKQGDQFQVLHLSMHAILEDKNPSFSRLIFTPEGTEDGFLFTNELTALNLKADLAVLSACNTGAGQLRKGEGVLSLARAFNYAGVPATVHSLWKVPDEATKTVMVSFYQNLKAGTDKATALNLAKQAYLTNEISRERKHPYYWAGFVLNGNWEPIQFESQVVFKWYYMLLGLFLFSGIWLLYQNKIKSKA